MEVEIWSDIACPWCYIGKRRFEAALEDFEHSGEVRVTYRSFELDPAAPPERDGDRTQRLAEKYGVSSEEVRAGEQRVVAEAASEGLEFRFDIARSGSTFDAHRIVHLAADHGLQEPMNERLLRAHFTEGRLVSDPETLVELAVEIGVPEQAVRETLAGERYADRVRADERTADQLGVRGVPMFVIDRALGVSGAYPSDVLRELLLRGWQREAGEQANTP